VKVEGVASATRVSRQKTVSARLQFPRVPGHEVAGRIDALGSTSRFGKTVRGWALAGMADTVYCEQCRRGDFAMCINRKVTGIDFDGGYAST